MGNFTDSSENISDSHPHFLEHLLVENDTENLNRSHANYFSDFEESVLPSWWKLLDVKYLRHSNQWIILLITAYVFNLFIGMIGNIMTILVVFLRPQMRTVTNIFILNLAVADLFVVVFCVGDTILSYLFPSWKLSTLTCNCVAYAQQVSICASAYSLAALALERCKAIYKSYGRSNGLSKGQCQFTISFIWITALMLNIPWALTFNTTTNQDDGYSFCGENWSNDFVGKLYFLIVKLIICFCLPLLLISVSNLVVWCHVNHRKIPRDSDSSGSIRRMHRKARRRVLKVLGLSTFVFILCWLPLNLLALRIKFGKNIDESEYSLCGILVPFAQLLATCSCSVNSILCAFFNKKFKKVYKSFFLSCGLFAQKSGFRARSRNRMAIEAIRNDSGHSSSSSKSNRGHVNQRTITEHQAYIRCSTRVVYASNGENAGKVIVELNTPQVKINEGV